MVGGAAGATEIERGERGRNEKEGENGGGDDFGCLQQSRGFQEREDTARVALLCSQPARNMATHSPP